MHPDIVQSLAAERVRDMRSRATAGRRAWIARRVRSARHTPAADGRRAARR
jgi:hypothetical protein